VIPDEVELDVDSPTFQPDALDGFTTEMVDPTYRDLDLMTTDEMVRAMNEAEAEVPRAVAAASRAVSAAVDAVAAQLAAGGRLLYVGAGTPGRLGVLDASECPPTFSTEPWMVQGIIAGGPSALTAAIEGAEDDEDAGRHDLDELGVNAKDAVVGISASGRTPYVLGAVRAARAVGAVTVGVSSNEGSRLSAAAEFPIEVVVGPEIISGSTRLKAGSAQKQVLNMLSTLSMVKLGKTYGNLMVDVSASNRKLEVRAQNLVREITGVDVETARAALAAADQEVKTAIVCITRDVDASTARGLLAQANGFLRRALGA
jgi:N-acetylmuramic acid 6-phosphate etherase